VEYETREWVETIPRQQTVTEYQERRWTETVPREVVRVDQYAIEYLREYVPEVVATSSVQVIPQERLVQRTEFYPVERRVDLGIQNMRQLGGVVNVGAPMNHTVTSLGFTQGETFVTPGVALPPQVVNYIPGVPTGVASGVGVGVGLGVGVGPVVGAPVFAPPALATTVVPTVATSTVVGGYGAGYPGAYGGVGYGGAGYGGVGYGAGYGAGYGVGYSGYGATTQTPGVVTNVGLGGTVTQTPVMVTNTV